jgi:probable H4MPT-linked C1 transfer pathway protein
MSEEGVMGWDIGGANLKAACLPREGPLQVFLEPCPLWQGPEELPRAMDRILRRVATVPRHVVTMTGELADCFTDRAQGVRILAEAVRQRLAPAASLGFYTRAGELFSPEAVVEAPEAVASANWRATAHAVSRSVAHGLVVDIGSTTSDLIPVRHGAVQAWGQSDATRLQGGELLYTGVTRTPVMAAGGRVPMDGAWVPLTAEWFATMADVHRLRGALACEETAAATADGGPATPEGSARRLARMVGRDIDPSDPAPWRRLADYLAERQLRDLLDAAHQTISRVPLPPDAPLVGAGIGRFLIRAMAERVGRPYRDFNDLVPAADNGVGFEPADCAPAVSLALLGRGQPVGEWA